MEKFDPKTYAGPVRALDRGFYGRKRREPGEEFTVEAGAFSTKWMEVVSPAKAKAAVQPKPDGGDGGGNPVINGDGSGGDGSGGGGGEQIVPIPEGWETLHNKKRMALAKMISGLEPESVAQADVIIKAEADNRDAKAKAAVQQA